MLNVQNNVFTCTEGGMYGVNNTSQEHVLLPVLWWGVLVWHMLYRDVDLQQNGLGMSRKQVLLMWGCCMNSHEYILCIMSFLL